MHMYVKNDGDVSDFYLEKLRYGVAYSFLLFLFVFFCVHMHSNQLVLKQSIVLQICIIYNAENELSEGTNIDRI